MNLKKSKIRVGNTGRIIWIALLLLFGTVCTNAQQGGTTQYFYDDNGRLTAVVAPDGETALYDYDAAGNILAIRRLPAGTLTLFSFNPQEGVPGDQVTFLGSGFVPGQTTVFFNGANAAILEITATQIVAEVPNGATTGIVTITTPNGSVATPTPFTIRGMKVSPATARIYFGDSLQLTATVYTQVLSTAVQWSVNGNGGSSTLGTISNNGLYTAPPRTGFFTLRATLIEDPTIFSEAVIEVRDPNNLKMYFSSISVRRGLADSRTAVSAQVSVRKQSVFDYATTASTGVSVRRGLADSRTAVSAQVSVRKESLFNQAATISSGVSVRRGLPDTLSSVSSSVSVSNAPLIESIVPLSVRRGLTTGITITGSNMGGVTKLTFINAATGELINNITVSNITINTEGTSLSADLTIPSTTSLIKLLVILDAPETASQSTDTGKNTIQITQ